MLFVRAANSFPFAAPEATSGLRHVPPDLFLAHLLQPVDQPVALGEQQVDIGAQLGDLGLKLGEAAPHSFGFNSMAPANAADFR